MIIFWLVLRLEISYYRVIISRRILVFFLEDFFLKIKVLHGEIFEFFHNSSREGLRSKVHTCFVIP
jgi:hypothetical protein